MRRSTRELVSLGCGLWLGMGAGPAVVAGVHSQVRPLAIQDAVWALDFQVQGIAAAFSPDGDVVASTVCDPRRRIDDQGEETGGSGRGTVAELRVGCDLWLTPTRGGPSRNLTLARGNSWGPSWSRDGSRLAFFSDRDGKPQLWVWNRQEDRVRRVSEAVTRTWLGSSVPSWTADDSGLIVQLLPEGMSVEELEMKHGGPVRAADAEPGSTVVVYRSPPETATSVGGEGAAASGFASHLLCDLAVVDVGTGEVRRLVARARPAAARVSPDASMLAYLDARAPAAANTVGQAYTLVALDLASGRSRDLVSDIVQSFPGTFSWSPDGSRIAYTAVAPTAPETERFTSPVGNSGGGGLFVVPVAGGDPQAITGSAAVGLDTDYLPPLWEPAGTYVFVVGGGRLWKGTVATSKLEAVAGEEAFAVRAVLAAATGNVVWSPDADESVTVMTRDERSKQDGFQRVVPSTGTARPLLVEDREYGYLFDGPVVSPGGDHVVFVARGSRESPDLWIADGAFSSPRRLTTLNPELDGYTFGEGRLIDYTSSDGDPLRASVLLPAGYQEGTRYPTVVWVYASDSGSRAVHRFGLVGYPAYNMQMLATRGYAVLWPDIPTHLGSPMQDLMKAVMPAIDRAIELGISDPDHLALMGQSGGGYSTLALLVQTTRFKAAVMNAGYGDLAAMYGQMGYDGSGGWIPWLERLGGSMGAPPWEVPLRYVQNSPVFYLDRIQTPLIVQAGSDDESIVPLSDEVWVGLQRLGKKATYLRYEGEGHVLVKAANLVDYWKRVLAFFDEHLTAVEGGT